MIRLNSPSLQVRPTPLFRGRDVALGQGLRAGAVMVMFMILLVTIAHTSARAEPSPTQPFQSFIAGLWPKAEQRGVSQALFAASFEGMTPDEDVIAKSRRQPEFTKTIQDYLASAVTPARIEAGLFGLSRRLFPARAHHRPRDSSAGPCVACGLQGVMGGRHGPDPVHAFELPRLCR